MDISSSVYQSFKNFPLSWKQVLFVLAEEDSEMFWMVLLRMRKYHRLLVTGNKRAWNSMLQEEEEILQEVTDIFRA